MDQEVLAIDVGGTKVALALIDRQGTIRHPEVVPTAKSDDADVVFSSVADGIRTVLGRAGDNVNLDDFRVGIGSAGPIDGPAGTVSPVNIGAWRKFPIRDRVAEIVTAITGQAPRVGLAGDGHCMALGEHWLGAGRDVASMIGMVLSTGVGGGVVMNDRLFTGLTGNAVHLGHISVNAWGAQCVCGSHGCVEMYARGPALVASAHERGWRGGADARALTAAAREGDWIAIDVIDHGMRALAAGIATTATELDVAMVILGGGVSKAGAVIFDPLRRHLADFAVLDYVKNIEVRPAELENAGLIGAGALALSQLD